MSIWTRWAWRVFGPVRAQRMLRHERAGLVRRRGFESLETRRLLTITTSFVGGVLTITADAADNVAIGSSGGNVTINSNPISGPVAASAVTSIGLTASGVFNNVIDLSGIDTAAYTALTAVSIDGGGGIDQLITAATPSAAAETIGFSSTQITRSGGEAPVTYSNIETLNVSGTAGVDTFNVTGSPSGTTTLDGLGSGDQYNVTQSALGGALTVSDTGGSGTDTIASSSSAAGPETIGVSDTQINRSGSQTISYTGIKALNVSGTAGTDTLTDTTSLAGGETIGVTGTTVNRSGGEASLTYSAIENLKVNGTAGVDTFNVTGSPSGTTTLDGLGSGDQYNVTQSALGGALTVSDTGASGTDTIASTTAVATGEQIGVSDTQITRDGGEPTITYSGVEALNVSGTAGTDTLTDTTSLAAGETIGVTGTTVNRSGGEASLTYSAIENLKVNGTAGIDTFNVTGSPSGTTTLDGLASGDTYNVTQSALGGALTVSDTGVGVGDQLFSTTGAAGGESIGVSDTQITRSGGEPTITYSGVEALNVSGTAGTDTLTDTTSLAAGETIGVTGTTVNRSGGEASLTYSAIENLKVNGTAGIDTFNVTGSPSGTTTLDGLASGDTYNVTQSALGGALTVSDTGVGVGDQLFSTTGAAGGESIGVSDTQITRSGGEPTITYSGVEALNVSGTAGTDTLTDTTSLAAGETIGVTGTTVTRSGGEASLTFSAIENLTVNGTAGVDTFNVTGSPSGTTTLDGLGSGDQYNVTQSALGGALTISDTGASGTDTIASTTTVATGEQIGVSDTQITRDGGEPTITYSGVEALNVSGTAGTDTLTDTTSLAGGETIGVTGTTVNRSSGEASLTYSAIENLKVNGTAGADTFNVTGSPSGTTMLDGLGSGDQYNVTQSALGGPLTVSDTGASGTDTLASTTTVATGEQIGVSDTQITRDGGEPTITYSGIEALNVSGTAGTDTLTGTTSLAGGETIGVTGTTVTRSGGEASLTYSAIENLKVNGTAGVDTFNVTGSPGGTTMLDGLGSGDQYNVTQSALGGPLTVSDTGASGTDTLASTTTFATGEQIVVSDTLIMRNGGESTITYSGIEALNVSGTAGTDTLTDTTSLAGGETIGVTGTTVTRSGGEASLTYSAIENLKVNGTAGVDTFNVTGSPSGTTTLDGLGSGDQYNVTQSALGGPLIISDTGASGTDTIASTTTVVTGEQIGVSDTQITRDGGEPTITYGGIEALNVSGTAGTDTLTDTTSLAGGETIGVTATTVNRSGGEASLTFSAIENLKVNGTAGVDTFNVTGSPSGTTTLDGLGSGDQYNVTQSALGGPLTVSDTGSSGTDQLLLTTLAVTGETIAISSTTVTRSLSPTVTYGGIESLTVDSTIAADNITVNSTIAGSTTVNAGDGNDVITLAGNANGSNVVLHGDNNNDTLNIRSVATGSTVQVFGDDNNDTINVGNTAHKLDDIQGTLTVNGNNHDANPPGDTLVFDDSAQTTGHTYTLTDTTLTRSGLPHAITFGTVETMEIDSGSGNDQFTVNFSTYLASPAMVVKFNGGGQPSGGMDTVRINGTAGNDTVKVGTFTSVDPFRIQNIECLQLFGGTGADFLENDTAVGSLIDGGDGNDTLVGGSAVDVIFGGDGVDTIYGRGGGDYLFGDHEFNNRNPQVKHASNGDVIYGDQGLFVGDPFATNPGVDHIVAIGSDTISTGGQVGDTVVGVGLHITVVDWLKARFLNPNGKNIQTVINAALAQPCTHI